MELTPVRPRRSRWRRWFAPLVVAAALAADYGSPAALWTAAIPLVFMAPLLVFRQRLGALTVLLLSSWIAIPAAAGLKWGLDTIQGRPRLLVVPSCVPGHLGEECAHDLADQRVYQDCFSHDLEVAYVFYPPLSGTSLDQLGQQISDRFAHEYNRLAMWNALRRGGLCEDSRQWVVLSEREASRLRSPCSRNFTADLVGSWQPEPQDVARAEAALPAAIAEGFARRADRADARRPAHYHRQYAGFRRGGERVLYLNAVAHLDLGDNRFRDQALVTCEGGTASFGAVFDPAKNTFDSFEFNAGPGGRLPMN